MPPLTFSSPCTKAWMGMMAGALSVGRNWKAWEKYYLCYCKKGMPQVWLLPGSHKIADEYLTNFDVLITFGCSHLEPVQKIKNLTHSTIFRTGIKIINIDHHPDNSQFGQVNIVDHKNLRWRNWFMIFIFNSWPITKDIALRC